MAEENAKSETENHSTVNFELIKDDETVEFPERTGEKTAIDAEVLSETKAENSPSVEPAKEASGIAKLLANLRDDKDVSIIITRLADKQYKNQFRLPCETDSHVETIYWDGEPYPDSIYSVVKKKYGGGHYRFQLRYDGGFKEAWKDVLSDPSEFCEKELLLKKAEAKTSEQPRTAETSQSFANPPQPEKPVNSIKDAIEQLKDLRALQTLLAPETPAAAPMVEQPTSDEPRITKEFIKLKLIEHSLNNPALLEQALQSVFEIAPKEADNRPKGFWETIAASFAANPKITDLLIDGVSTIGAPLANLVLSKAFAPPAAAPTMPPFAMRPPQVNTQPTPPPKNEPQPAPTPKNEQLTAPVKPVVSDLEPIIWSD